MTYEMWHTRCDTRDATFEMRHTRCDIRDATYEMWHTRCDVLYTRYTSPRPKIYEIRVHDVRVHDKRATTYEPRQTTHHIWDMTSYGEWERHTRYDIRYTTYKIRHTRYDIRDMTYMIHHTWYNIRGKYIQTRYDIRDTAYAYLYYIIGTAIGILLTNMKLYLKHPKSSNTQYIFILWVKPAG